MKRTLGVFLGLGIVIGLGYLVFVQGSTTTVVNDSLSMATSTVEVGPSAAELLEQATQEMIAEAIAASSTEIESAVEAAAQSEREAWELKIERDVRGGLQEENDARIIEIEKQTKVY